MMINQQSNTAITCGEDITKKGRAWVVYLNGSAIDIVWFKIDMTRFEVRQSLVYHDGYPFEIELHLPC